ncbi:LysM peptidoglycan-binding domain-containing protein [Rhodobacteraceae bacterium RKSG542]|uniref:peptidoglycan DD-metalloendopeptidase family protein n=1 Tax=Pseudovibrio flavus TaxID=2529854 RepID=UPI0012BC9819|nr:peptidoglycan DD-metalloendopeptidase family protein [Pseudovibrio flavus]MTI15867.1 LysM peptidoglycan-binding domain-containing protein [Pseudovibrio flavus]
MRISVDFHRKLTFSVAVGALLAGGLAGCSSNMSRFGNLDSDYEEQKVAAVVQPQAYAQPNPVVAIDPANIYSAPPKSGGAMLPPPTAASAPVLTTASVAPTQRVQQQTWQPTFSKTYNPPAPQVRKTNYEERTVGGRVPASVAKAPTKLIGWTPVGGRTVVVKSNETAESLAWQHNVPLDALLHANKVTVASAIQPGRRVVIPVKVVRSEPLYKSDAREHRMVTLPSANGSAPVTTASIPAGTSISMNSRVARQPVSPSNGFVQRVASVLLPPGNVGEGPRGQTIVDAPVYNAPVYSNPAPVQVETLPAPQLPPTQQLPVYQAPPAGSSLSPVQPAPVYAAPTVQQPSNPSLYGISAVPQAKPQKTYSYAAVQVIPEPKQTTARFAPQVIPASTSQAPTTTAVLPQQAAVSTAPLQAQPVKPQQVQIQPEPVQEPVKEVVKLQPTEVSKPAPDASAQKVASAEPQQTSERYFRWPVRGRIISEFGPKPGGERNDGINLAVPEGTEVKAAEEGTIVYAGNELKGFGNLVLIRHDGGWVSAYAHNKTLHVRRGDVIRRGQTIATTGSTGSVSQPQLHFELRKDNRPVDPMAYLPQS